MKKKKEDLVANFMSLPKCDEILFQSEPKSFSKIIDQAWENWGIGVDSSPEKKISENWHKIVGRTLASKCAPDKLSDKGVLFVKSSSGPIKQELSFAKQKILLSVRKLESCSFVREIRIH